MKHKPSSLSCLVALSLVAIAAGNANALTVSLTSDSNPSLPGELRHAIANTPPGGTVDFAPGLAGLTIALTPANGSFTINQNLTIDGTNAPGVVISGSVAASVFTVNNPATAVTFHRLTIRNGSATNGGGISVLSTGTVTVSESTIELNQVTGQGGGIHAVMGGRLDVKGCLIANNSSGSQGGGIYAGGAATLTNTTVSGNGNTVAPIGGGGGLYAAGNLTVTHCTFFNNAAGPASGGHVDGIFSSLRFHLINSIIASGRGNMDCYIIGLSPLATNINNLIADGTCSPMLSGLPLLAALANNGGPTQTHALLPGSPCLDAGSGASSNDPGANGIPGGGDDTTLSFDQRGSGFARVGGAAPDIGAFEFRIQPDNLIGKSPNPATALGNNRYNTSGVGQTLSLTSKQASLVRATLNIQNDGDLQDAFKLRGSRGNQLFEVSYTGGGKNLTAAVTAGTYMTPALAPNQTSAVSILVKPDRKKLQTRTLVAGRWNVTWLKRRLTLILSTTSRNNATSRDVAKVRVNHL